MDQRQELFWPVSRALLDLPVDDPNTRARIRSLISYQLLFGGRLLIRDSDYINFGILRSSVQGSASRSLGGEESDFFSELFDRGELSILRRENSSLSDVAGGLSGVPWLDGKEWFHEFSDLEKLDGPRYVDQSKKFNLNNAAEYYSENLIEILGRDLAPKVSNSVRERLHERALELRSEMGVLKWGVFSEGGAIWTPFTRAEQKRLFKFIHEVVGQAPHVSFVPSQLGLSPIYMDDVADAIALWRGRFGVARKKLEDRVIRLGEGQFSFSDYASCLASLSLKDISQLAVSAEGQGFHMTCKRFGEGRATADEVMSALRGYRGIIDARILTKGRTPKGGADVLTSWMRYVTGEVRDGLVDLTLGAAGVGVPLWKLGLNLMRAPFRREAPGADANRAAELKGALSTLRLLSDVQDGAARFHTELYSTADALDREVARTGGRDMQSV